jgi:hypothetical protein
MMILLIRDSGDRDFQNKKYDSHCPVLRTDKKIFHLFF